MSSSQEPIIPERCQPRVSAGFGSDQIRLAALDKLLTSEIRARLNMLPSANVGLLIHDIASVDANIEALQAAVSRAKERRAEAIQSLARDLSECWSAAEIKRAKIKL